MVWLNTDDRYRSEALAQVQDTMVPDTEASIAFGHCLIIDLHWQETRRGIARFKEAFFPTSSRFTFQCINYLSKQACFFRRSAVAAARPLCLDLKTAWNQNFFLRLWRQRKRVRMLGATILEFFLHDGSTSGQHFRGAFDTKYQAAKKDPVSMSLETLLRWGVTREIIEANSFMERWRKMA
ncbi:MAG: hypothetical protein ACI9X0_000334 [Kiritimatiellia bacterium]